MEGETQPAPRPGGKTELIIAVPASSVHSNNIVFKGTVFTKLWPLREHERFLEGVRGHARYAPWLRPSASLEPPGLQTMGGYSSGIFTSGPFLKKSVPLEAPPIQAHGMFSWEFYDESKCLFFAGDWLLFALLLIVRFSFWLYYSLNFLKCVWLWISFCLLCLEYVVFLYLWIHIFPQFWKILFKYYFSFIHSLLSFWDSD